jgi:catechol 2,3-dioxygenase-like lactoylglutathione lyase family enzyme
VRLPTQDLPALGLPGSRAYKRVPGQNIGTVIGWAGHRGRCDRLAGGYFDAVTTPTLASFVATTYVRDLNRSRAFYQALGFVEQRAGRSGTSAWCYLRHDDSFILVATSQPAIEIPALPLLFYFFVTNLAEATSSLAAIGHEVEQLGRPPHALGGEVKTTDPDGNTILLGQAEAADGEPAEPADSPAEQFSLLREAAALALHKAGAGRTCEVITSKGSCGNPAEVKLADTWGDTLWACLTHAEDALINAPAAFIANQNSNGLGSFLATQRRR